MHEALKGLFWFCIMLVLMIVIVAINTGILFEEKQALQDRITVIEQKLNNYTSNIDDKADKSELTEIKFLLEEYRKEVDDMVFKYQTLDALLKQLGSEAQRRYELQHGK